MNIKETEMKRIIHAAKVLLLCLFAIIPRCVSAAESIPGSASAIFAGGCFWCMEPPYDKLEGVFSTTSGYIGGHVEAPSYEQVSSGSTGHVEAVLIEYDPNVINYEELLEVFWRNIDPLDDRGQFCDRGEQYRSAIFYRDERQLELAQESKAAIAETLDADIATEILMASEFYPAEEYHQDYYMENPLRYRFYRFSCGRDGRLEELWSK